MSTRVLKWLGVILPVGFWLAVLLLRATLFQEDRTSAGDLFALTLIALGATVFSLWVFGIVENREAEIRRRSEQLAALHNAALALTMELDLGVVLQKVIDLARDLVHARYGALGVLDPQGEKIDQFIISGITPEERARVGELPRGHGLLGVLIKEGKAIRIPEIARDARAVGFPPHHPPMHSLLGVPIISKGRVIGDLYLTDKLTPGAPFTIFSPQDQEIVEMFATQAAIAIENAQLYRQTQQLTVLKERERFGMDLHDGIIQSIYAIGLMLEDGQHRITSAPHEANQRITRAMQGLNDVIRDIRNYILDLRPQRFQGRDLKRGLEEMTRDLRANSFLTINLHLDSQDFQALSPEQTVETLHVLQEALTNIRKHAQASAVQVRAGVDAQRVELVIEDNGVGFNLSDAERAKGNGLRNMRERARLLRGTLRVESQKNGGTRLTLHVPVEKSSPPDETKLELQD
ncbi:MAG: GAF domain-containing sensor histidine kinase [Chloroflexi bacterium]|nr:GAF domain-containing sensor histidine kinase [Chloroflexota bacterium]MBI3740856.1 GAF domain-containing sensor histidine kinase [Chloroflexota bacterium]